MNKVIKAVISFAVVVLLVMAGLLYLTRLTERKENNSKFVEFYEQEENFDVLFLGSSHTINAVFPMELWKDYGIISYNMGIHMGRPTNSYWLLKNALDYTKPELVVVDAFMLSTNETTPSEARMHAMTDSIPFGKTKIEMIYDLEEDRKKCLDYLWEFTIYHNRWNDLKEEDFKFEGNVEKGAESRIAVANPGEIVSVASNITIDETIEIEYLCRLIEECQKESIDILLTYLPFPDCDGSRIESEKMIEIAHKYNINYLDYNTLAAQVNFNTDCYDYNSHLNPSGARKITDYLGKYIVNEYDITDHRNSPIYSKWFEDYQAYKQFKIYNLKNNKDNIDNYLMLLNDKNLSYGIYLKNSPKLNNHKRITDLLENLDIPLDCINGNMNNFIFVDTINQQTNTISEIGSINTCFGDISLQSNNENPPKLIVEKNNEIDVASYDIYVIVFDNDALSFIDNIGFNLN